MPEISPMNSFRATSRIPRNKNQISRVNLASRNFKRNNDAIDQGIPREVERSRGMMESRTIGTRKTMQEKQRKAKKRFLGRVREIFIRKKNGGAACLSTFLIISPPRRRWALASLGLGLGLREFDHEWRERSIDEEKRREWFSSMLSVFFPFVCPIIFYLRFFLFYLFRRREGGRGEPAGEKICLSILDIKY